jgi:hypothetical protein
MGKIPWNKGKAQGPMSAEQKEKHKVALEKFWADPERSASLRELRILNGAKSKGREASDKARENMRSSMTQERKEKLREINVGNKYGVGNTRTPEGQARSSVAVAEANHKRVHTEESRLRRSQQCKEQWVQTKARALKNKHDSRCDEYPPS